jgi:hypothetical protein
LGHNEEHCWLKSGCCLICGDENHKITSCARFRPRPSFPQRLSHPGV